MHSCCAESNADFKSLFKTSPGSYLNRLVCHKSENITKDVCILFVQNQIMEVTAVWLEVGPTWVRCNSCPISRRFNKTQTVFTTLAELYSL